MLDLTHSFCTTILQGNTINEKLLQSNSVVVAVVAESQIVENPSKAAIQYYDLISAKTPIAVCHIESITKQENQFYSTICAPAVGTYEIVSTFAVFETLP